MRENNSGFKIDESQRQSWLSIAAVWAGGMICVPCLMIGGVLAGGGLSLGQIVLSILIGYGLICVYMICIGMQACDTGLPVSVMASGALGEKGARYIISALLAIACVGWFGIQSATCGSAFASMVANMLGTEASPIFISISSIVWGVIMLLTACITNNRQNNRILYVSIQPLQSLVDSIVGGDFEAEVLVPAGASPETFEPTPRQFHRNFPVK